MDEAQQKLISATEEACSQLAGTALPCSVDSTLPYTVPGGVKVSRVSIPKVSHLSSSMGNVVMEAEFDIVFKQDVRQQAPVFSAAVYQVYPLVAGDAGVLFAPVSKASMEAFPKEEVPGESFIPDVYYLAHVGDSLHFKLSFTTDETEVMRNCQQLRFVDKEEHNREIKTVDANRKALAQPK